MEDDDPELLPDPPAQASNAAATTMPAAPPESEGKDFWTCMEHMTARQSDAIRHDISIVAAHLDNKITTGLQTLETKLTTDLRRLEDATTKNADDIKAHGQARGETRDDQPGAPLQRPRTTAAGSKTL